MRTIDVLSAFLASARCAVERVCRCTMCGLALEYYQPNVTNEQIVPGTHRTASSQALRLATGLEPVFGSQTDLRKHLEKEGNMQEIVPYCAVPRVAAAC